MDDADTRADEAERPSRLTATRAARKAVEQLAGLTGRKLESVVGIHSENDAFTVVIEAVEDPHVPSTADVMAEYEVQLDEDGELVGYRRQARYVRGSTDDG
ncbi:gas vesicle protein [Promicromonospora sp. MEB111]|uniref:gas vesicle protein GvpO n=1 Tax=unclassified Promicromonospora TaxID=2647929 RepID=UPI00254F47F5|nr:gas vesicle protein [Promicromonospora sp. MEB111]